MKTKTSTSLVPPVRRRRIVQQTEAPARTSGAARPQVEQPTAFSASQRAAPTSVLGKILGVYVDPQTWGALFFILISLATGILYFTWAVTGLSLSISFLILIIGLPFAALFFMSVRGLALVEAHLVQASLGTSLAPPPLSAKAGSKWWERLKALVMDRSTWLSLLYLVLQMPLDVIYFSVTVSLLALALGLMTAPFLYVLTPMPVFMMGSLASRLPFWVPVLIAIGGFLLLTFAMHVIRGIGRWHVNYARALLGG